MPDRTTALIKEHSLMIIPLADGRWAVDSGHGYEWEEGDERHFEITNCFQIGNTLEGAVAKHVELVRVIGMVRRGIKAFCDEQDGYGGAAHSHAHIALGDLNLDTHHLEWILKREQGDEWEELRVTEYGEGHGEAIHAMRVVIDNFVRHLMTTYPEGQREHA